MREPISAFRFGKERLRKMNGQSLFEPGMIVKHPQKPDWGLGQVQSSVGGKVTVNFQEVGKVVVDESRVNLMVVSRG